MYRNEDALPFYSSMAWKNARKAYKKKVGGVCERCLANGIISKGEIVHHKVHLNARNIHDPNVALNEDNFELLCRECHAKEHEYRKKRRWRVDEEGRLI